jgi:hypothetical protein
LYTLPPEAVKVINEPLHVLAAPGVTDGGFVNAITVLPTANREFDTQPVAVLRARA